MKIVYDERNKGFFVSPQQGRRFFLIAVIAVTDEPCIAQMRPYCTSTLGETRDLK